MVRLGAASQGARANRAGRWHVDLPEQTEGGPYVLEASTRRQSQRASDIMIGDVYLCSGQSNMEFETRYATNAGVVLGAAERPNLRLLNITRRNAFAPVDDLEGSDRWALASPEAVSRFSAVCYFFGAELLERYDVPVGLINASWGGTIIQAWMSEDALRRTGEFDAELALAAVNRADPEAARARHAAAMRAWWDASDPGTRERWFAPEFDATTWTQITPANFWESSGEPRLALFDGIVWYRTEFTLSAEQAAQGGRFELGPADDIDAVYLNGQFTGGASGWDTPRAYDVAPNTLRAGRNVLAAAVLDTGGGGGFWGPANEKLLRLADGSAISLDQPWRFQIAAPLGAVSAPPQAPWDGPNGLSVLHNGMIAQLAPYGLAGVLWYQGESNAGAPEQYARLMPAWMADWRRAFNTPDLPFFVVQLANFGRPAANEPPRESWGGLRDVQRRIVAEDSRAGLAVTIDIGDRYDIHPTQKRIVAERLARIARHMIYGDDIEWSGPSPQRAIRSGAEVTISFAHAPLAVYSSNRPIAFELCNAERDCRFAEASIHGQSVRLLDARAEDAYVRYCWGDSPVCNLYNDDGLPAIPFELAIE
jgi:sialate O-acetylesterase